MAPAEHEREQAAYPEPEYPRVTFRQDNFLAFIRKLHRKHSDEWIALLMGDEDATTGVTWGRIIAHDSSEGVALRTASQYHELHPDATLRFFNTAMALADKAGMSR